MSEMTRRFGKVEHIEKLADATCPDPRFKKQASVNHLAAEDTVKRVTAAINPAQSEEDENASDPSATVSTGAMFWDDFDERVASPESHEAFCYHF